MDATAKDFYGRHPPRRDRHPVTSVESARLRYCPSSNTPRNAPSKRLSMGHTKGL